MASRKKIDKFVYLYEKDRVKGLFGNIELYNSNISHDANSDDEQVEESVVVKTDLTPAPLQTEAVVTTAKSCSCCQVKFDSGRNMTERREEILITFEYFS